MSQHTSSSLANNIGPLRLMLASLVIIGHSPQVVDGGDSREPLVNLLHTVELGSTAVDGFFILSGFLITRSFFGSHSVAEFLKRRVARIYPGFVVAYLLSAFVLAPITGGYPWGTLSETFLNLVLLRSHPFYPGQLNGLRYFNVLNGSIWTIAYEFRCYLLTLLLGVSGVLRRRRFILVLTAAALGLQVLATFDFGYWRIETVFLIPGIGHIIMNPPDALRLGSMYLVGTCIALYWDALLPRLSRPVAATCLLAALLLIYDRPHTAQLGLAVFGSISLFWLAFKAKLGPLGALNQRWDISYGVYLYGWPIAAYFRWLEPDIQPTTLTCLTLPLAYLFGAASWWGIEKRVRPSRKPQLRTATASFATS